MLTAAVMAAGFALPALSITLGVPSPYPTIADGLIASVAGDTVLVAAGTYLEHDLILLSGVVLRGATGDPADVVIDGEQAGRCIYGAGLDATTRIEALTLTHGLPALGSTPNNSWGGGLFVDGGSLTVAGCVFLENRTAIGGGAFVHGEGTPTFLDCLFDRNDAEEVAGLSLYGVCDPVVRGCTFTGGNRTMVGGGVSWLGSGTALIEDCIVENNAVWETGGGVEVFGSKAHLILRNCLIRGNTADRGAAGLQVGSSGRATLENCTITENTAGLYGGGVNVGSYSRLEALQTTILGNTASLGPDGTISSTSMATLTCCEVDLDFWDVAGSLTVDDEGCGVAAEHVTWGEVKSLFR